MRKFIRSDTFDGLAMAIGVVSLVLLITLSLLWLVEV